MFIGNVCVFVIGIVYTVCFVNSFCAILLLCLLHCAHLMLVTNKFELKLNDDLFLN